MHRGITGDYETAATVGEPVKAFVPRPLPPDPPMALVNSRQRLLERATLALGRLDSITLLLPDPNIFLPTFAARPSFLRRLKALNRRLPIYSFSNSRKVLACRLMTLWRFRGTWPRWNTA